MQEFTSLSKCCSDKNKNFSGHFIGQGFSLSRYTLTRIFYSKSLETGKTGKKPKICDAMKKIYGYIFVTKQNGNKKKKTNGHDKKKE